MSYRDHADVAAAVQWILSLDSAQRAELADGKLGFDQIGAQTRNLMTRIGTWDPEMGFVLISRGNAVGMKLGVDLKIAFNDPKTGQRRTVSIPGQTYPVTVPQASSSQNFAPLDAAQAGPLDFGAGSVLPLSSILEQAQDAFRVRYAVDDRIASNLYFVSGHMTQKAFEDALNQVTTVPAVRIKESYPRDDASAQSLLHDPALANQQVDITRLRDELPVTGSRDIDAIKNQFGDKEQVPINDFLSGKTESAAQLSDGKPGLSAFLASLGIQSDTLLTLSAVPVLAIQADGMHQAPGGSAQINGKSVPLLTPNATTISLE